MSAPRQPKANTPETNTAFILRLTWDSVAQERRIVLKPIGGGVVHVFSDLESAFLYLAQLYTNSE